MKEELSSRSDDRLGITRSIKFVRSALRSEDLVPRIPEIEEFIGQLDGLPLLQLMEAEQHQRTRRVLNAEFSAFAISRWDAMIKTTAKRYSTALPSQMICSLRDEYVEPLVWRLSTTLVGISTDQRPEVHRWSREIRGIPNVSRSRRVLALLRFNRFLGDAEPMYQVGRPIPLLLSLREKVEDDVVKSVSMAVLTAGVELVTRSVLACIWAFVQHPHREQPDTYTGSAIKQAVGSARIIPGAERLALRDTIIEGEVFRRGETLRFDVCPGAGSVPHERYHWEGYGGSFVPLSLPPVDELLPFGFGAHFCLGAAWTHHVARFATAELFRNYASLTIIQPKEADDSDPLGGPADLMAVLG